MNVIYIGESKMFEVWANECLKKEIIIKNGDIYHIGFWNQKDKINGMESILTKENEWICDKDSLCAKMDFIKEV